MAARSHCEPNNEGPVHGLNISGKHYARYIWYRAITSCGGRGDGVERAGDGIEAVGAEHAAPHARGRRAHHRLPEPLSARLWPRGYGREP